MEEIEFIYQVSSFDIEALMPQVSAALEKRMQIRQEMLPKLFRRSGNAKKKKDDRFEKAAREFLEGHAESMKEEDVREVCFSGEEMITVMGALEDLDQDAVSYDAIELLMEADDIFFVVYQGRGVILQKKNLTLGTVDEFREFAAEHIKPVISLIEEE